MKLGIVLNTNNPETAWNAFRLGKTALDKGNSVSIFLLGSGVEIVDIEDGTFDVTGAMEDFLNNNGSLLACGTCLKLRHQEAGVCPVSTMVQLVEMISASDRVVTLG